MITRGRSRRFEKGSFEGRRSISAEDGAKQAMRLSVTLDIILSTLFFQRSGDFKEGIDPRQRCWNPLPVIQGSELGPRSRSHREPARRQLGMGRPGARTMPVSESGSERKEAITGQQINNGKRRVKKLGAKVNCGPSLSRCKFSSGGSDTLRQQKCVCVAWRRLSIQSGWHTPPTPGLVCRL